MIRVAAWCTIIIAIASNCIASQSIDGLGLVPIPKKSQRIKGEMVIKNRCTISVESKSLVILAKVMQDEMQKLVGLRPDIAEDSSASGDIVLRIDRRLKKDEYRLETTDTVVITGGSYQAVAMGTVSFEQLLSMQAGRIVVPRVKISDYPDAKFRGLMVDLARRWHPMSYVKECVELCRWYKINYLQFHFTDDQLWTLPSNIYPKLPTPGKHYTFAELRDLEAFAVARGVTIVPELEVPGHAGILAAALPDAVATSTRAGNVVSPGRESTYKVLDQLIGEVCSVFKSTPYFHIGADEVNKDFWVGCTYCSELKKSENIETDEELYRYFIARMDGIVKKRKKQMIVWEGFKVAGKIQIPKDITVMGFESYYEMPQNYLAAGYTVINTSWKPLYVVNETNWSTQEIYAWNMYRWEHWWNQSKAFPNGIDVPITPLLIGAQMCTWDQMPEIEISSTRRRLPALSERLWQNKSGDTFEGFSERLNGTDACLTSLLSHSR
jgi:hexosaminidase